MSKSYVELTFKIHQDGEWVEVGEDSDGAGFVRVSLVDGQKSVDILFDPDDAQAVANAIVRVAENMRARAGAVV